ncbi:MAG: ABC transporter ATP-binding protein [Bacteroidales bacterium]
MLDTVVIKDLRLGYFQKRTPKEIFSPFSTQAKKGELLALLGRNGQGKSTLLRTIIGLQPALSGDVFLQDKPLKSYSLRKLATMISYVSTDSVKVGNLKVFDLVSLGRYPYTGWLGNLSKKDKHFITNALECVGMQHSIALNANTLSDGERQRVLIARALAQDTPIIILDEPTAFLDLPNKYEVVLLLKKLAKEQGKTIIFSTHDLSIAIKVADAMWLMAQGEFYQGTPQYLLESNTFDKLLKNTRLSINRATGEIVLNEG